MRYLGTQLCLLCVGFLPLLSVHAQDEALETITVIAEPEPQTGDVQHEEHTGSHRRISKTELQRQDVNLGDILANETGVQFRQVGGLGTLTTVTLRGASSAQTGVFLDGILLNSAGNSSIDLSLLELLNLSSVDVYQGSTPAQLSNANIGGAINLNTLSASKDKAQTNAALTGGSFNTKRIQLTHSSSHNQWDVVAAASHEQSDNRFKLLNNNATPLNPADDRIEKRNNAQAAKFSALSRVGYQWKSNIRSDLLIQATSRDLGIPEWLNNENNVASYDTDALQFQLVNRFDGIGAWNTSLSVFQHFEDNHFLDALNQIGLGKQDTRSNSKTTGIKSYWERIGDNGTVSLNTEYRRESLDSEDELSANQNYIAQRHALLSSLQYSYFAANERILITPSVRLQTVSDSYDGLSLTNNNNRSDTNIKPQIGIRFVASDALTLRSSLGQFIRQPAFSELYGSRGLIIGNNKLVSEEGINADVGFTYKPATKYQLTVSLFGSWRDELVVLTFDSRGIGRSENTGKANVVGVEINNDIKISQSLSLRINATYQRTQNIAKNPALNKLELPGEARFSTHAKLQYQKAGFRTWLESNYKSDFFYDSANLLPSKAHWLHNASVAYRWRALSAGFTVNNIGNESAQDFNGFPRPGRSYFLSLTYQL